MYKRLLLSSALFLSTACLGTLQQRNQAGPPPEVVSKQLSEETHAKTTEASAIRVFQGKEELPRGLFFYQDRAGEGGQLRSKLFAVPQYPSADAPHVVIAGLGTVRPPYDSQRAAVLEEYKRRASAMGANSLFVLRYASLAFAIIASDAAASAEEVASDVLARQERSKLAEYKPLGSGIDLALGQAQLSMETERARCYGMTVVLGDDATLNNDAENALYISLESADTLLGNRSLMPPKEVIDNPHGLEIEAPRHGRFLNLRSFSNELGCTSGKARAEIRFWTSGNKTAIGEGHATVQLFERKISNAQLAQLEKESAQRWEEARIAAEQQRIRDEERERAREQQRAEDDARRASMAHTSPQSTAPASTHFSLSLKNECSQTVKLFIGDKPKFGSGTSTQVSANSINSYSGSGSQTYWIVDSNGNGMSSFTATPGSHNMRITSSCSGFAPR